MRIFVLIALAPFFLLSAFAQIAPTPGQPKATARQALQTLEKAIGTAAVAHVVGIVGFEGREQPESWQILVEVPQDDRILHEFVVRNSQLSGPRVLQRSEFKDLPQTPVLLASLKLDSREVFQIADDQAISAGVRFEKLNYQLRWRGNDSEPTWMATLLNAQNHAVGHVFITSASGKVVHTEFFKNQPTSSVGPPRTIRGKTRLPISKPASAIWTRNTAPRQSRQAASN